jgi:hypothetical protein
MKIHDQDLVKKLLHEALPPVASDPEPGHDLWPALRRRMNAQPPPSLFHGAFLDWALLAGLAAFVAFFPASIPVLLYYL